MRILVSGGPVHAKLDSVKLITNNFRGGRMVQLAEQISQTGTSVTWLSPGSKMSDQPAVSPLISSCDHSGFYSYQQKLKDISPSCDAVVLGAAVANLIPVNLFSRSKLLTTPEGSYNISGPTHLPLTGKFPSHDYETGESIFMEWKVAPRIINEIHSVSPHTKIFGFKLLKGVPIGELIEAAYEIVIDAHATCVFANLREDLDTVYAVMKDRSVHKIDRSQICDMILDLTRDEYYHTVSIKERFELNNEVPTLLQRLIEENSSRFIKVKDYIFGTIAVRSTCQPESFYTTSRGKNSLSDITCVLGVNHTRKEVRIPIGCPKATLNAPLLAHIFEKNPKVNVIQHYHCRLEDIFKENYSDIPVLDYAPPGTVRDSTRTLEKGVSFEVSGHGVFILSKNR